jgi:hypothetical protein
MTTLVAHFDGRVLVPEKPVALPTDCLLEVRVSPLRKEAAPGGRPLAALAALADQFPPNPDSPGDAAVQHDRYLYGTPKKA